MRTQLGGAALLMLPGALTVYLSFNSGGFFVTAPAIAAVMLAVIIAVRALLSERPFAGFGAIAAVAAGALALYAAWTLLSTYWSGSPARSLLEFDRALLYVLTLVLFASLPRSSSSLRWALRGVALGITAVSVAALASRLAPDLFPVASNIEPERLSHPLTYWNALGLLASTGIVLCFHLAASEREPPVARVLGAAAVPALAVTLFLTFSRGAIAAAAVALIAYVVLGRPRALVSALLSAGAGTVAAVIAAYGADEITTSEPTPAAVAEGHDLALFVALCMGWVALLRSALLVLDGRLTHLRLSSRARRPVVVLTLTAALLGVLALSVSLDAPGYVDRQYERFAAGEEAELGGDPRARLSSPASRGRLDHWEVALDAYREEPLTGNGAGTYRLLWARDRQTQFTVNDGHSLYLETLAELGLVGLALLVAALLALLVGLAARVRGEDRHIYAAVLGAALAWILHAGIDWDWEMPAVTVWLFALGGIGVAAGGAHRSRRAPSLPTRAAIALASLGVAITPVLAANSQSDLDRSVAALEAGRCEEAVDAALGSIATLGVRPEPWEVLGYCDARLGAERLGVRALENAVARDPENWEVHYGLALVRGTARLDPRPAAREAQRLNPREPLAVEAVELFRTEDPAEWERRARQAALPLPRSGMIPLP